MMAGAEGAAAVGAAEARTEALGAGPRATAAQLFEIVDRALREDAPWGDATAAAAIPAQARTIASIDARESGVLAGSAVVDAVFARVPLVCPAVPSATVPEAPTVAWRRCDGDRFAAGDVLATVAGPARALLTGERVALNLLQRLSGVATLTRRFVDAVAGTSARIVDTRKTTPGLRALERDAVLAGGGHSHRRGLSDAVMVKDNHLAVLVEQGLDVTAALHLVRERIGHTTHLEVEVDRLDQLPAVLAAGPDSVLLDNFTAADLREGVRLVGGRALVEASGGVRLETVAGIARTGVDLISVGALTHSARALDLGLDVPAPGRGAGNPGWGGQDGR